MAQNLQGLCYEVDSSDIATTFRTQIIHFSFWYTRHYTLAACYHVTRTCKICLHLLVLEL